MSTTYHVPATVEDAVALLAAGGTALAGGQDLVPLIAHGHASPSAIVDLRALEGLHALATDGPELVIGALVTRPLVTGLRTSNMVVARSHRYQPTPAALALIDCVAGLVKHLEFSANRRRSPSPA